VEEVSFKIASSRKDGISLKEVCKNCIAKNLNICEIYKTAQKCTIF
jgi:hypothetical protein